LSACVVILRRRGQPHRQFCCDRRDGISGGPLGGIETRGGDYCVQTFALAIVGPVPALWPAPAACVAQDVTLTVEPILVDGLVTRRDPPGGAKD